MGTIEIIIVFSALMALIALVTIGIDWIGKPLKHRRFIPRLYRFEDEKLPVDAYGHTTFEIAESPEVVVPPLAYPPMHAPPVAPLVGALGIPEGANATVQVRAEQPDPRPVARVETNLATTSSAFSDSVGSTSTEADPALESAFSDHSQIAGRSTGSAPSNPPSGGPWTMGKPIDAAVDGHKPSLAVKAERFWRSTASVSADSHFDSVDIERMRSGKAPRRVNPRTGRNEAMQLTGLRRASSPDQVRMRWPDEIVDPWNPS